ncbi:FAD-dependent oxidoreductase [Arthrobacter glacialis]|uniref:NAD(P)/FAD-dependent oxidoreductase n=1 Tax=Arthrobacter glacialis TaxID=1664 RepID=A0A2S4A092_ARTGL|nr:FAD-dependent oxidoreductase [Arthrobacter glacialis]POH60631.1 NAD(P)/FAD-dependent oxidoreductase [Arthrobacter glacialis]POH74945.1 NAD(P)/FAD-dependent oxidoreductase [Arthrobacter glacialis]
MTNTPLHIVVVGYGPVAARFVDQLLPAVRSGAVALTVIGEESAAAYNRVLVADLGVGRTTAAAIALSDAAELVAAGVNVHLGTRVLRLDRARQQVRLADGTSLRYSKLVFATGARPVVPPLHGLNPDPAARVALPRGVTALRDLADAAQLSDAVDRKAKVVVLGGGILGLEAALAAQDEGASVTVVHHGTHALARSIDAGAGHTLAAALRSSGITVISNARSVGVQLSPGHDGELRFSALLQESGAPVEGDLLVLSCGVRPRVEVAAGAGLATDRGILVDHRLAALHDPNVFAMGDCAQVRCLDSDCADCAASDGPLGLIGPGWRQAEWLADFLTGSLAVPLPAERAPVMMLKARGVDVAAAGEVQAGPFDPVPGLSVSQWADPEHGKYVKMSTRDGVLAGFISVGMPRTGAELTLLFERGSELPADRSALLRLDGPDRDTAATADPARTVCRCAGVAEETITAAAARGCSTVAEVSAVTRAGTGCGGCHGELKELIEKHFAPA